MKATEALTLEACLIALAKLETELPPELHQTVQGLGHRLKEHDPQAIAQLREVVSSHDDLRQHYEIARLSLQEQYQSQERAKGGLALGRGLASADSVALADPATLTDLAWPILTADDFRTAAQRLLQRNDLRSARPIANRAMQPFLTTLERTVSTLDLASVRLMKELERKPATLEDLSFWLAMGLEQIRPMANRLCNSGYISPLGGNFLHMLLPLVGVYPQKSSPVNDQTPLTLTAKGYFKLNPVIEFHGKQA
ncbi:MAG: hypothetical protein ACFCVD_05910 [Nodosilinea sp.]